ncbi:uroporphyrinogen-III synthase [Peribacillus glennii]|uniref:Uroporphyrinogen-III synthase n=1 Tax=Peribacillus glennii TaxID=2303991 RepID=A0A372LHW4_9BACI|nr:uroporphyrinogen-III synthase [Peribacillus glennii]RFU65897.1 uroporphyrinogen-III synthase [Peribacillus glennii]
MRVVKPLQGYNILVTRGEEQSESLSQTIAALGGNPYAVPLIDFALPKDQQSVKKHIGQLNQYDWLIFTSQNGVKYFFELEGKTEHPGKMPKIAVIGSKTKQALAEFGYRADFLPDEFVAEAFTQQFVRLVKQNDRVLVAKGNLARSVIWEEISRLGAECQEIIVYETIFPEASEQRLAGLLRNRTIDIVTFTSSSTANHFMNVVNKHGLQMEAGEPIIVCIGPIAKKTAEKLGLVVHVCPDTDYTAKAMIDSLIQYLEVKNQEEERV